MKRSRAELAELKIKILDAYLANNDITDAEMAKRFAIDNHTVAKYRREWYEKLKITREVITDKIVEKVDKDGIWTKIIRIFQ